MGISEIYRALRWYTKRPEEQFTPNEAREYDIAAKILTDREGFANFLVSQIGPNQGKLLEVAAGTGLISKTLHTHFQGDAIFTDKSPSSLELLKEKVGSTATTMVADFLELSSSFEPDTFDTIVCVGGYRYVPHEKKESFWKELGTILKPQGRLFIAQFYPRGFSLRGEDIGRDFNGHGPAARCSFDLKSMKTYRAKMDSPLPINSGRYLLFEFGLNPSDPTAGNARGGEQLLIK